MGWLRLRVTKGVPITRPGLPTTASNRRSVCDDRRVIEREEARRLLRSGIRLGMVSSYLDGDWPQYVWAVDGAGEVYEAKLGHDRRRYHGYRVREDDRAMRKWVIDEWSKRTAGHSGAATERA